MSEDKKASAEAPAPGESTGSVGADAPPEAGSGGKPADAPAAGDESASSAVAAVGSSGPSPDTPAVPLATAKPTAPAEAKASAAAPSSRPSAGAGAAGRRVYQAGATRKTLLSIAFLLLLPFFASLPAMVYQRITHQLWADMLGFAIFAAAFVCVMLLVAFELIHSIRSRVEIGESAVRLTLPAARGIAMPKLFYRKQEIPFSSIDTVESRREVYGGTLAPVMLRGARIVTKTGDKIPLGYVSEANIDPMLPVPEIASEIAKRAGLELVDRGTVRREVGKKLRGIKASDDAGGALTEADIAVLNRRHNNVVLALCGALFLLVAGGLLLDISSTTLDRGERAHQLVQEAAKPSPQAQRK
ncbi:MAG: hypothetical protein KJZ80_18865 [Hyphomicrobiaceae bacterium]|nr:hypothetical protein [Hyphomicrobiaceae bacterium]